MEKLKDQLPFRETTKSEIFPPNVRGLKRAPRTKAKGNASTLPEDLSRRLGKRLIGIAIFHYQKGRRKVWTS